eukprot:TRINITY_DN2852_c0_g1_i5.p1 TRINITY_DN2852_c0_g1~~TRINITY_DN2852_c0_g1_i5.p1  ORF type:complete len:507 (+),score=148.98 TRINITY_DN2852_c0_g1_i5:73-1593(+)
MGNEEERENRIQLKGFCFSPYLEGQSPGNPNQQWNESQIENRLIEMTKRCQVEGIRTYGSSNELQSNNDLELNQLIQQCNQRDERGNLIVDVAIVGNEVLLRKDLTIDELIKCIQFVRDRIPHQVQITTAEPYGMYYKYPQLIQHLDLVYVHIYAYWDQINVQSAIHHTQSHFNKMVSISNGKKVVIAEIGWPSAGEKHGEASPNQKNASQFFQEFLAWSNKNGIEYFYFEAFDEGWKVAHEGERGAHWGVMDSTGSLKEGFSLQDEKEPISGQSISIQISNIQQVLDEGKLQGTIKNLPNDGKDYSLACFIKVDSHWWTKPTFESPCIPIYQSRSFNVQIYTGEGDVNSSEIGVFLVPSSFSPPLAGGIESLPDSLFHSSICYEVIHRESLNEIDIHESPFSLSSGNLSGTIRSLSNALQYHLAVFIKVGDGWWTKPTFVHPVLFINPQNNSFSAPIFTGPNDSTASELAIFLLSKDCLPPKVAGSSHLPHELFEQCKTHRIIHS